MTLKQSHFKLFVPSYLSPLYLELYLGKIKASKYNKLSGDPYEIRIESSY